MQGRAHLGAVSVVLAGIPCRPVILKADFSLVKMENPSSEVQRVAIIVL
jgi:hypothetical protein